MSVEKTKEEKPVSLIEKALLEAEQIQKTAEENAKEILTSSMKSEINRVVRESIELEEENSIEENLEESHEQTVAEEVVEESTKKVNKNKKSKDKVYEDKKSKDKKVNENDELDNEYMGDESEMGDEYPEDISVEPVDLTDKSDDDVIQIFKKMGSEDQIEITKDGNSIQLKDEDKEYLIKLNESEEVSEETINEECPDHDSDEKESETIYEIELGEEESVNETEEVSEEENIDETMSVTHAEGRNITSQSKNFAEYSGHHRPGDTRYKSMYQESVQKNKQLINENESKVKENSQLISVVKDLRTRLNEVALFNTNLAYVNRLMTEQTSTKKEKVGIIKRFDKVKTIDESKSLYKSVVTELNKKPINESVEKKVVKTSNSGSFKKSNETKEVVSEQVLRMQKLMVYKP